MNVTDLLHAAGGLDREGSLRLPQTLWTLLEDAPRAFLMAADSQTVVAEMRMTPGGGAVYHPSDEGYQLLSPEELEELLRANPRSLAL